uniref:CSON009273 protein n=1 Tax=Culicoides sonorensis TaxID=179676 RepID=A0A336N0Y2_CULSO
MMCIKISLLCLLIIISTLTPDVKCCASKDCSIAPDGSEICTGKGCAAQYFPPESKCYIKESDGSLPYPECCPKGYCPGDADYDPTNLPIYK